MSLGWWWVLALPGLLVAAHLATTGLVRWSSGRRVLHPLRPRCIDDHHDLAPVDVVPLGSWLRTRGRCRTCGARVPVTVPLVELLVVAVLVATVLVHRSPALWLLLPVAWSAVVATPIDLAHRIIPNRLTYPLAAWSFVAATAVATATGAWGDWRRAMVVGLAVPGAMLALSLLFELLRGVAGIGMGDIKWSLSLGIAVGWLGVAQVLVWLLVTALAAGGVGIVLLATGRAQAGARIPYGPYLAIGALVAILTGDSLLRAVLL